MFRLLSSGLPKDPVFPADLTGLGYFINDEDEIRSIKNPRAYFNFFLTKNERYNLVQREAMNSVIRDEVYQRLHKLDLETVRLPLGAQENEPHVPILVSASIKNKKRVIVSFYEHNQDLGVFAHRIIGGKGGINKGSAVNFVKYIQSLASAPDDNNSPGIILANMGQLKWWRRGKKAVTQATWFSLPQKTAVSRPLRFDRLKNTVPGNRSTTEHVDYVLNKVVKELLDPKAILDIIGVTDGAVQVVEFLNKPENWTSLSHRIGAVALLASFHCMKDISNKDFAAWFQKRGRAYIVSTKPLGTALAGPAGSAYTTAYGCPTYSLGEPYYSELMLPKGYHAVLDWFQEVASDAEYENPEVVVQEDRQGIYDEEAVGEAGVGTTGWGGVEAERDCEKHDDAYTRWGGHAQSDEGALADQDASSDEDTELGGNCQGENKLGKVLGEDKNDAPGLEVK